MTAGDPDVIQGNVERQEGGPHGKDVVHRGISIPMGEITQETAFFRFFEEGMGKENQTEGEGKMDRPNQGGLQEDDRRDKQLENRPGNRHYGNNPTPPSLNVSKVSLCFIENALGLIQICFIGIFLGIFNHKDSREDKKPDLSIRPFDKLEINPLKKVVSREFFLVI